MFLDLKTALSTARNEHSRPWAEYVRKAANKIANTIASSDTQKTQESLLNRNHEPLSIPTDGWILWKDKEWFRIIHNIENDIWEYIDGPYKWTQYFSLIACKRESKKYGRQLPRSGKTCRLQIEEAYRPFTLKLTEESNYWQLKNHEEFLQKEWFPFRWGINPSWRHSWTPESSGIKNAMHVFWCADGSVFCVEKGASKETPAKDKNDEWCFYSMPNFNPAWKLPVYQII